MVNFLNRFRKNEDGSTAIEYALIMCIVALGIVSSLQSIPGYLVAIWTDVASYL